MDNNTLMIIYAGLAIGVIFYFVVSFFSSKTWKIPHVLLAVAVFFGAGVFLVMSAATLKTHQAWREVYLEKEQKLSEQLFQNELLFKGYAKDPKGELEEQEDSIRELGEELEQELYDRARVWRGCAPGAFANNSVTVTVTPPDAAGEAPAELTIPDRAILYAFKEYASPEGWSLPGAFVGEFEVTGKTATAVTLKPTIPLDQAQLAEVQNSGGTWVLYDLMPVDSYDAFADLYDPDAVDPEADFRAKLQQIMTPQRMKVAGPAYEQLIDQYARDRRAAEEGRDPPNRIWKKVRFLKVPEPIKVDSDDESPQFALRYYDATGRAVPASLRSGDFDPETGEFGPGEIEFDIGDVALLDSESADRLIAEGVCEELESVFVRELRDYGYEYHEIHRRTGMLDDDAVRVRLDTGALVLAHGGAVNHVTYRTGEKEALDADVKGLEAERQALVEYLAALNAQWQQLRQDLSLLYRTNNALVTQLSDYQASLTRMINQQTPATKPAGESPRPPAPPSPGS